MNIVLVSNTFTPHVGGVARSVEAFVAAYRQLDHRVLVIAPEFENLPTPETDVVRVPAIRNFNASDFSVALPAFIGLNETLEEFRPDIIHSQHPFLLGNTAVRISRLFKLPLVFTHHTLYEQYTHYVPGDSAVMQQFVIELATSYANLSDMVFAPSESIEEILIERGVKVPIRVIPTGVKVDNFSRGEGRQFREQRKIPLGTYVIGHMGRLAPEKNLNFLTRAVIDFLKKSQQTLFMVVGSGPSAATIKKLCEDAGVGDRLILCGTLEGKELADALTAMDLFVFSSKSETQGMVLTEAMAAGVPIVALDASGAREVVKDMSNGRLVKNENLDEFTRAIEWMYQKTPAERELLISAARKVAEEYSLANSAAKALACFQALSPRKSTQWHTEYQGWEQIVSRLKAEWELITNLTQAGEDALTKHFFESKDD